MAKKKVVEKLPKVQPPATTPEARENQMIALAVDLAEKQLRDGTASPSVITHYLKLATQREKLEQDMLVHKSKLMEAKTEAIESAQRIEELYSEAINAMRKYSGSQEEFYEDDDVY